LLAAFISKAGEASLQKEALFASLEERLAQEDVLLAEKAAHLRASLSPGQVYLRGLFSGGTLCYEAQVIWKNMLSGPVLSNAPLSEINLLPDSTRSRGHTAVDLGEEEFTVGRPHPMIDNDLRIRRLLQEAQDPETAVILLDVVLGYGAHPDPAAELGPAILRARQLASESGRDLPVVASVTGTEQDPQGLSRQTLALENAGAVVCESNAAAARLAAAIVSDTRTGTRSANWRDLVAEANQRVKIDLAGQALPDPAAILREIRKERDEHLMSGKTISALFSQSINVINVGLESMAQSIRDQGLPVVDVDWKPPAGDVIRLQTTRSGIDIDAANQEACDRIKRGRPVLAGMGIAREVIPGMHSHKILHAGPPVTWERMCGPQRGAVMGALIYEGLASGPEDAAKLAGSGAIEFEPCHHNHAVGPMAGVVSPSMPVFILENKAFGNRAYCTQNEGLGKVLRYGGMGPEVYARLKWMETSLYPTLDRALQSMTDGIDVRSLIAQALHMGDECHNRNRAATSLFLRAIGPALARTNRDNETLAKVIEFIDRNDHFFLNLSMPAGKSMLEPAEGIEGSTIVTVMARNGTDFGIRLACMPERWFIAPAGKVQGLYFPAFTEEDANPDIGDSTITETAGYGGMAMAAAPAITQFVGGSPDLALHTTLEMYEITFDEHENFTIPGLNFRGTPLGIDVRRVIETGILPQINTGIAHKEPGVGMVGAGILRAPEACFREAYEALRDH
jgi:hypothetical protein